jgi:probable HAF family extracellular repeat protein
MNLQRNCEMPDQDHKMNPPRVMYRCLGQVVVVLLLSLAWFASSASASGQNYTITDLGSNTWYYSEAHGINISGHAAGEYEPTNPPALLAGFLYSGGVMTDVGILGGAYPYSIARAVNETDVVVGEAAAANNTHAFSSTNGFMTDLGTKAGMTGYSSAYGINRSGQIVGDSSVSFAQISTLHAMMYAGGTWKDLGVLGGDYSAAFGINNSGVIVGESDIVESGVTNVHAFVYTNAAPPTTMQDLKTLPGGTYSSAKAINDSGVIVGESDTLVGANVYTHAFVWRNGSMTDLQTLGGATSSASGINSAGQIVGYATDANEVSCAFLYSGSTMVNLNNFIPTASGWTNLASAEAINDVGQIVGYGYLADGSFHAYLLSPAAPITVTITNPAPNATFTAPASFVVGATAFDTAGTVTNVQFLSNGSVLGNSTSAPYGATATGLNAGSYTLTAIASDNLGLSATNSIGITVTDAALGSITISNAAFAAGTFSFSFGTQIGYTYAGQFTTPLSGTTNNWLTFTNLAGNGSVVSVTDPAATNDQRYYRVVGH